MCKDHTTKIQHIFARTEHNQKLKSMKAIEDQELSSSFTLISSLHSRVILNTQICPSNSSQWKFPQPNHEPSSPPHGHKIQNLNSKHQELSK